MASLNKVILMGNVGRDPEVKDFGNGSSIALFSVATSELWTDKATGERKERTEWTRVSVQGNLVKVAKSYVKKGSTVYIEGKLHTRKWKDQNGVEREMTEVKANVLQLL